MRFLYIIYCYLYKFCAIQLFKFRFKFINLTFIWFFKFWHLMVSAIILNSISASALCLTVVGTKVFKSAATQDFSVGLMPKLIGEILIYLPYLLRILFYQKYALWTPCKIYNEVKMQNCSFIPCFLQKLILYVTI